MATKTTKKDAAPKPEAEEKAAEKPKEPALEGRLAALEERIAVLESAMRLELGVDPAAHKAAQERVVGGPAGDAGSVE